MLKTSNIDRTFKCNVTNFLLTLILKRKTYFVVNTSRSSLILHKKNIFIFSNKYIEISFLLLSLVYFSSTLAGFQGLISRMGGLILFKLQGKKNYANKMYNSVGLSLRLKYFPSCFRNPLELVGVLLKVRNLENI